MFDLLLDKQVKIYIACAGAGAGLQSLLWEVPGASDFLVGASYPYSRDVMSRFLGYCPDKAVSRDTAINMAIASYVKAGNRDSNLRTVGLGLTAAVATNRARRGEYKICCAVITRGEAIYRELTLSREARNRFEEGQRADQLGGEMLLRTVLGEIRTGECGEDVTQEAREALFARPLFTKTGQRRPCPTGGLTLYPGAFNPPHEGHFHNGGEAVTYQITATSPHKDPLSLTDMLDRAVYFQGLRDVLFLEDCGYYLFKARRFPRSTIILGSDAALRLTDPQWVQDVEGSFQEFEDLGTRFKVSLRGIDTLEQVLAKVPKQYWGMFQQLPDSPYRNLSSTQIRAESSR